MFLPQEGWEGSPLGCRPSQPWALLVKQGEHVASGCISHLMAWYLLLTGYGEKLSQFDIFVSYQCVYWLCKCDSVHCSFMLHLA